MFGLKPEFLQKIQVIRKKFEIDPSEFDESNEELDKKFMSFQENMELYSDVEKIRKELKLSEEWQDFLVDYVITDYIIPTYDFDGLKLEIEENKNEEKEYKLILTKNTTLEEIIFAWPQIEKELGKNNTRNKPWKKFWRDYDIYTMTEEGKTVNQICSLINEKYGDDLEYGTIIKTDSSFRKKMEISNIPRKYKLKIPK
jgi:hypothetical protein